MSSGLRHWAQSPQLIKEGGSSIELIANPPRQYTKCEIFLIIILVTVLICVAIVSIISIVFNSNSAGVRTYCPSVNGTLGYIRFNANNRDIVWRIQYPSVVGTPTNLYIHGPVLPGATTAVLYFSICGYPSSLACDLSVPGVLSGSIGELNPGGTPLTPIIEQVQANPSLYYATINNQTLGGLGVLC